MTKNNTKLKQIQGKIDDLNNYTKWFETIREERTENCIIMTGKITKGNLNEKINTFKNHLGCNRLNLEIKTSLKIISPREVYIKVLIWESRR